MVKVKSSGKTHWSRSRDRQKFPYFLGSISILIPFTMVLSKFQADLSLARTPKTIQDISFLRRSSIWWTRRQTPFLKISTDIFATREDCAHTSGNFEVFVVTCSGLDVIKCYIQALVIRGVRTRLLRTHPMWLRCWHFPWPSAFDSTFWLVSYMFRYLASQTCTYLDGWRLQALDLRHQFPGVQSISRLSDE